MNKTDKKQIILLAIYFAAVFGSIVDLTHRLARQGRFLRIQNLILNDLLAKQEIQSQDAVHFNSNHFDSYLLNNEPETTNEDHHQSINLDHNTHASAYAHDRHQRASYKHVIAMGKDDPLLVLHRLVVLLASGNNQSQAEQKRLMHVLQSMNRNNQELVISNLKLKIERAHRELVLNFIFMFLQVLSTCCAYRAICNYKRSTALLSILLLFVVYFGVLLHDGWQLNRKNPTLMLHLFGQIICSCILYAQSQRSQLSSQSKGIDCESLENSNHLFNASFENSAAFKVKSEKSEKSIAI